MNSSTLLGITTFTYLFSTLLYVAVIVFKAQKIGKIATIFTAVAWLIQTAGILLRWSESYQMGIGHAPLTNMYESVVFFSWTLIILYLIIEIKFKTKVIGAFTLPFAFLAMAYASFSTDISKTINPLIPALQSNWLISHVVTCFIGYASFAVAAALGIMYLIKQQGKAGQEDHAESSLHLPPLTVLDSIIHSTMVFGFIWLSAGIITGAIWANSAWGTYWSWDPKETWSLITWFFYAITLHARYTRGWNGAPIAFLAIFGFLSVLFTYYGVNFLLSGLHSYGSS
ncbi:c-type cytochrome biogenesis protein CcsB [Desulforhopalus sp. IMCC35007]|uniref:c-type cytochrome biogenesis protein CcsB n=1 Tax=Desulforhopalus sp. IMCC35007 TaxID=2569543 RepID=UPI0010ADCA58|nr:c-type cytochrome biogenesis protein CcsB [Desulforhopalus sp. IMCC35007]TKB09356.1 c-type cytochrome biogenesis protein CcsB [Desulforhopalus sp. IMCC35007]